MPPTLFLAGAGAMAVLHMTAPGAQLINAPWRALGFVLIAAGAAMYLLALMAFREHSTVTHPFGLPRTMVATSVFRWSRNPMYLGMLLVLLGFGVLLGSVVPFVVVLVFAWLVTSFFILREEEMMREHFGDSYLRYQRRVRRWI